MVERIPVKAEKTNTQGKKDDCSGGERNRLRKNVQTQADQLKNDCIILFQLPVQ